MSHDNDGPREGQENGAPSSRKPEEFSPEPVPVTALVGTADPFIDELNRLCANVDADVLRFRAREAHAKGMAHLHEATRHMRMEAELNARAAELEGEVREARRNAAPDSDRRPVVPNDNRLPDESAAAEPVDEPPSDPHADLDPPFAVLSNGTVLINAARLHTRTVHASRTWTGVMLAWVETSKIRDILRVTMDDAAAIVIPFIEGRPER